MGWKRKEKDLEPEEALALARQSLEPYWHNSLPLIGGITLNNQTSVVPLEKSFTKTNWLMFFIDPCTVAGESTFYYAQEIYRRYSPLDVHFLFVIKKRFHFLNDRKELEQLRRAFSLSGAFVLDTDGALATAFGIIEYPALSFLDQGKPVLSQSGLVWNLDFETKLQTLLRQKDSGLPLPPAYRPTTHCDFDKQIIELGRRVQPRFTGGAWGAFQNGYNYGSFTIDRQSTPAAGVFALDGAWMLHEEFLASSDQKGALIFTVDAPHFSIIAQSVNKDFPLCSLLIDLNDRPAFEAVLGADSALNEFGEVQVEVREPRTYSIFKNLPPGVHKVTIRFNPDAKAKPALALYSVLLSASPAI